MHEAFYRALVEQTSELVAVLAADGVVLYASPSHRTILGYEPEALVGRNAFDFIAVDDLAGVRARFAEAVTNPGRTASERFRFRHADGSWRSLEAIATNLLGDDSVTGLVVNSRDVTEREQLAALLEAERRMREHTQELQKLNETLRAEIAERERVEHALRRSEESYRHLVENVSEIIYRADATGRITYISPRVTLVTGGLAAGEIVGHSFVEFIHPDDVEEVVASFRRSLAGAPEPFDYRVLGMDGRVYWLRSHSQPIVEDGEVVGMQGILTDITERRRAEIETRQQREQLAHVQRLTTAGQMTAEIAHQINQPLAAIVNFAGGLAGRLRDGRVELEAMREVAVRISDEAQRAGEIIRRLRDFLRKGESAAAACDLNQLVRHVYGLIEDDFRRESIDVRMLLGGDLPAVCADAILIEQVILNLLRNALEALMRVKVRRLAISTAVVDGEVSFSVRDTGVGLPEGDETQIFDAFFTTKPEGLGLGLSVSRSIIEASGGRLWATANSGGGAVVGFTLPIAANAGPM